MRNSSVMGRALGICGGVDPQIHGILDRVGQIRHQSHAAARALAGSFGPYVAIHGTGEFDSLLRT